MKTDVKQTNERVLSSRKERPVLRMISQQNDGCSSR